MITQQLDFTGKVATVTGGGTYIGYAANGAVGASAVKLDTTLPVLSADLAVSEIMLASRHP